VIGINEFKECAERVYLLGVLRETGWNVRKASVMAGIHRTDFYKRMAKHGIATRAYRPARADIGAIAASRGSRNLS
jgi:DNA-binding NtrC family response regulator